MSSKFSTREMLPYRKQPRLGCWVFCIFLVVVLVLSVPIMTMVKIINYIVERPVLSQAIGNKSRSFLVIAQRITTLFGLGRH